MTDIATAFVEMLAARHVTLTARGKKLVMTPKSAFGAMSAAERATMKQHKAAILAVVRERPPTATVEPVAAVVEPCPFCYRSPCIGADHPAFATLHALDETERARRRAEQNEKDYRESQLRRLHGLPSPSWDL